MSFGFGVGDVTILTQLAWTTYKACKNAPIVFANLVQETQSLHAILQELEETLCDSHARLTAPQERRLHGVTEGCSKVLADLETCIARYDGMAGQGQRAMARLGFATADVADLRSRLNSQTLLLTSFLQTSQIVVEQKLRKLIQEVQDGKHEGSKFSMSSLDSLDRNDRRRWRTIRKQLEQAGITMAAFKENSAFIIDYMNKALSSGALEEEPPQRASSSGSLYPAATKQETKGATEEKPSSPISGSRLRAFSSYWKKTAPLVKAPHSKASKPSPEYKIIMLGISEAGKTTLLNQARLLSTSRFHPVEYNDCRALLWTTLIHEFNLVLDLCPSPKRQPHDAPSSNSYIQESSKIQEARDIIRTAPESLMRDEPFPISVMDALHTLWDEPLIRHTVDRNLEIGLSDNLEYLYKNMERIAQPEDLPSNDDILNIRVRTLGVSDNPIHFESNTFRIFDVPGERAGRKKWPRCFNDSHCITIVASLIGYCSPVESNKNIENSQLEESLMVFEHLLTISSLKDSIISIFLTKQDILGKMMHNHPLKDHDSSFTRPPRGTDAVSHAITFIANKFVRLAQAHNRILQVHCVNATHPTSQDCLRGALRFISSTTPDRVSNGTGVLMPCNHCAMGELFSFDHFEAPNEPPDYTFVEEEQAETGSAHDSDNSSAILLHAGDASSEVDVTTPEDLARNSTPDSFVLAQTGSIDWKNVQVKEEVFTEAEHQGWPL